MVQKINARNLVSNRDKRTKTGQKGFTQLLEGSRKAVARAKNLDVHVKHCFEVCRYVKGMPAGKAISHLEEVLLIDSDRKDIRAKARAIPYTLGSGNLRRKRSGPSMVGHRKGKMGPGRYPVKATREIIKLINSAMDNARHQFEDVDAEEMTISHIAAHRGQIKRGFMPRARGRATPKNHYRVNLEIFLQDENGYDDELEDDF